MKYTLKLNQHGAASIVETYATLKEAQKEGSAWLNEMNKPSLKQVGSMYKKCLVWGYWVKYLNHPAFGTDCFASIELTKELTR